MRGVQIGPGATPSTRLPRSAVTLVVSMIAGAEGADELRLHDRLERARERPLGGVVDQHIAAAECFQHRGQGAVAQGARRHRRQWRGRDAPPPRSCAACSSASSCALRQRIATSVLRARKCTATGVSGQRVCSERGRLRRRSAGQIRWSALASAGRVQRPALGRMGIFWIDLLGISAGRLTAGAMAEGAAGVAPTRRFAHGAAGRTAPRPAAR
jgi:hypothetical protein